MGNLSIPMTTAAGMGPLPQMLERMAGSAALSRVFRREALPLALIEDRDMRLPLVALCGLFEAASHEAGDRTFGLRIGEAMLPGSYGLWAEYGTAAGTLAEALRRMVATIDVRQTGSSMSLRRTGDHVVWGFAHGIGQTAGRQHADHVIGPMRRFVGAFLGAGWTPSWIELNYPTDGDADLLERHWHTGIRFGAPAAGIAIPVDRLPVRRRRAVDAGRARHLTSLDLIADARRRQARDPLHVVEELVALRLMDGEVDIDGLARLAGTSVRALQRTLHERGYSYREVLGMVRHRRAAALLAETDISITEIAMVLGYAEVASFTRAFVRWAGVPPSLLRSAGDRPAEELSA
ncbi:MAG: AraC family transcriptional regulator ligand-binding domain-containing protein [Bauldia sp.]|uniref:AraC family transcriptional regulator n=1 Tax=Bauldia sp. TaxID=2575872 RepID=UPI001D4A6858|nr:AraC family transcriptional regulator [Bauldia sp.]MCB1496835.1 AraC family transcriptional regulator ligand-binding domain-containing protein [Bauldia sp.]